MRVYKSSYYANTTVVEMNKSELSQIHFALCKEPRQTLKDFYDDWSVKPDIICNGGLFNMSNGKTMFDYKTDGRLICSTEKYQSGMGVTYSGELRAGLSSDTQFKDFVSGYPPLIANGEKLEITYATNLDYKARRTMLGYNDTSVFVIAVEGNGIKFAELQNLALFHGLKYAINLDGGGSTKILQKGSSITSTSYNRAVDNVICFYLKAQTATKTIYRCQVGAFKTKGNAEALASKIRVLEDTIGAGYKSAYVRYINNYYKVQVSAFSKKENAEKVVADLKAKGYNAFITTT